MIARSNKKEILDGDGLSPEKVLSAYDALARQNKISLHNTLLIHYMRRFIVPGHALSVLDVGTGNGAFCFVLAEYGRKHKLDIHISALEPNPLLAEQVRQRGKEFGVRVLEQRMETANENFDVIVTAQVLHHIDPFELSAFLRALVTHARYAVIISDLIRSRAAYYFVKFGLPFITNDPPHSAE
jgi:2-polyprenyl-3-methyl-5-hydroxy-6-metoxy-1,4-benzoquinol methylase